MSKRYLYLTAGTLVLLFVGLIYAWSIFVNPLEEMFGWQKAQTAHIFTLSMAVFCIGGILGGYIIRRKSAAFIIRCSAVLMSVGFLACANTSSLFGIYFSYGVMCSLGVGLVYNAVLSTIVKWFPDKSSLCSGILLMGFGAGGFLLGAVAGYAIRDFGVQNAFVIFAIICIVILILASFFIFTPKESEVIHTARKVEQPTDDVQTKDMIKTGKFWVIFLWGLFSSACALSIIGKASPMAQNALQMTAIVAAFAVGIISVFNGVGRVVMGFIYSKLSKKTLMIVISLMFLCSSFILMLALQTKNSLLIYPGFLLTGYAYGSVPSFGVSIIREYFGTKYYSVNMSVFNSHLIISAIIGSSLTGQIFGATGNYMHIVMLTMVSSVIAILFASLLKLKAK